MLEDKDRTSLVLRNLEWEVAKDSILVPFIGHSALKSLGLDNCKMLTAVCDKCGKDIEVSSRLPADVNKKSGKSDGIVAVLFGE